jgi:hypothetical protein
MERSMKTLTLSFKRLTLGVLLAGAQLVGGCGGKTGNWQEEVKLLDGRVITITQKRRYENAFDGQSSGNLPREFWLIFKLPEFGTQEITWHENLKPQVLNVYQGKLYVVGTPWTELEFRQYGKPYPEYVPYRYEAGQWQRIPFNEIPEAIYDTNLLIAVELPSNVKFVSFAMKTEEIRNDRIADNNKKISATFKSSH